jgi:hypothetical protein
MQKVYQQKRVDARRDIISRHFNYATEKGKKSSPSYLNHRIFSNSTPLNLLRFVPMSWIRLIVYQTFKFLKFFFFFFVLSMHRLTMTTLDRLFRLIR